MNSFFQERISFVPTFSLFSLSLLFKVKQYVCFFFSFFSFFFNDSWQMTLKYLCPLAALDKCREHLFPCIFYSLYFCVLLLFFLSFFLFVLCPAPLPLVWFGKTTNNEGAGNQAFVLCVCSLAPSLFSAAHPA